MLVYLATPYSHKEPFVRHERFEKVNEVAARLMEDGYAVFSPISHSHPIEQHMTADQQSWEFWERQDVPILKACDQLFVLMLDGWKESVGVRAEIEKANELNLPIFYLDPEKYLGQSTRGISHTI